MDIEQKLANTLIERPTGIVIDGEHFYLYPATLGRMQIEREVRAVLQPKSENIRINADVEVARIIAEHPDEALWAIAYATAKGKECMDNEKMKSRVDFLKKHATPADITTLFVAVISEGGVADLQQHYGIDKEQKEFRRISEAKGTGGTFIFGGKTIYGTLIAPLMEKYGWTLDNILWGISYANLQMLMADATKTIMLSKEEQKRIHPKQSRDVVRADDPKNFAMITNMNWD